MIAILTGDIVNSRSSNTNIWQAPLKKILNKYGKEPLHWEIYRGDSFQLAVQPEAALMAALHIKSCIKQLGELDVRIAIGLGGQDHHTKKITTSTGTAFVRSGESFDQLKKQNLIISTGNEDADETLNLLLSLALLVLNGWTETVAAAIMACIEHPQKNQVEIAALLNKTQSSVSEALKRGAYEEIKKLDQFYQKQISRL